MTIEIRIKQTENKSEAAKLQKILDSADYEQAKNLSAILANVAGENKFSKTADGQQLKSKPKTNPSLKQKRKRYANQVEISENKIRNRGRCGAGK